MGTLIGLGAAHWLVHEQVETAGWFAVMFHYGMWLQFIVFALAAGVLGIVLFWGFPAASHQEIL